MIIFLPSQKALLWVDLGGGDYRRVAPFVPSLNIIHYSHPIYTLPSSLLPFGNGTLDAGIHVFRGSPRGYLPLNNGLVVSDNPAGIDYRLRIFCRSDSASGNVGQFIGLDGTPLTSNSFFDIARRQPGEITMENSVDSQNALTASQQGVYTCRIALQSGEIRAINIGVYPSGFNSESLP